MTTPKELALNWFTALVRGDAEVAAQLVAPEFRYFLIGNMPASGWQNLQEFGETAQEVVGSLAGPQTFRIGEVTAEDDRVWIEAECEGPLTSGGTYANTFVFAMKVRDGKVVELKEFCDTLHAFEAMDTPRTRGPRKARQSPITTVLATVQSPGAAQERP